MTLPTLSPRLRAVLLWVATIGRTMRNKVKQSDITFHGRNASGYSIFTCYGLGLGQYVTDARGREAKRAALDYFNEQAKKG